MRFAVWLLGFVCHLPALGRSSLPYRLHPKQESFIQQLSVYEIVTPVRVNDFGESFPRQLHFRRRRSADVALAAPSSRAHYRLEAFGQRFLLNLSADAAFIAPSYTVTHLGARGRREAADGQEQELHHCFFTGHVNGKRGHRAVFSLCTGLIGTFTTHNGEYFLEPLMRDDGEEDEEEHSKPHLFYKHERKKRSATDQTGQCASTDNLDRLCQSFQTCCLNRIIGVDFFHVLMQACL
ncbi:hypothetical protein SRHO_G00091920 [Serrasalmus rhombeus]